MSPMRPRFSSYGTIRYHRTDREPVNTRRIPGVATPVATKTTTLVASALLVVESAKSSLLAKSLLREHRRLDDVY